MTMRRSPALVMAFLALAVWGCTQTAQGPTGGAAAQPQYNPATGESLMWTSSKMRYVVKGPTQLAETLSGNKSYDDWAQCAKGSLGPALNPAAPKPVSMVTDNDTRRAMLMAVVPDASIVITFAGFSGTDSQATIYTTTANAANPANVRTAVAELRKCASP